MKISKWYISAVLVISIVLAGVLSSTFRTWNVNLGPNSPTEWSSKYALTVPTGIYHVTNGDGGMASEPFSISAEGNIIDSESHEVVGKAFDVEQVDVQLEGVWSLEITHTSEIYSNEDVKVTVRYTDEDRNGSIFIAVLIYLLALFILADFRRS